MISYCFAKSRSSLREMEDMCRYDIRAMYLMDNQTPSHKTIGEFINEVIVPNHHIYSNYQYLDKHNIGNYVKFLAWNGESSGKNPQKFFSNGNTFFCLNKCAGIKIPFDKNHHQRYKDGTLYQFEGCEECGYAYKCKEHLKNKSGNFRTMELIPKYEFYKNEARINLLSRKGIEIRVNRSIQVEGTFGQIKENMDYIRIRRRGINKVVTEIMLVCLGRNIHKIFAMMKSKKISDKYWIASPNLEAEIFKIVKLKKSNEYSMVAEPPNP